MTPTSPALRADLAIIGDLIKPNTRILDLGCGDGALLSHLARTRAVRGYGLEIETSVGRGTTVTMTLPKFRAGVRAA